MSSTSEMTHEREFVHTRLIGASPERIFAAISDPARLARWWGPKGFSSTFATFEFEPGGKWNFTMHGPDGSDYPNECVFVEIVPSQRVVVEHLSAEHHFVLTITLEAKGSGTLVRWQQVFDTAEHKNAIAHIVAGANEQNLDRLATEVHNARSREEAGSR